MTCKYEMMQELTRLQDTVDTRERDIEEGVDEMEEGIKERDVVKRKILLGKVKELLIRLNGIEKGIVKDFKGEAFDHLRNLRKLSTEIGEVKASLEAVPESSAINLSKEISALREKVIDNQDGDFAACLKMSIETHASSMASGIEMIADSIVLESNILKPKSLTLVIPEFSGGSAVVGEEVSPSHYLLQINSMNKFSALLLDKTFIKVVSHSRDGSSVQLTEECSVASKLEKLKGEISNDGKTCFIKLRRPSNIVATISVYLLGCNIINSPITHEFPIAKGTGNVTIGNETLRMFDKTCNDSYATLDITGQKTNSPAGPVKHQLLSNPQYQPSPAYNHNLPERVEMQNVIPSKLNDTTPFNPNPSYASTMRATMASSNLAGALKKMSGQAADINLGSREYSKIDESDLSILAPSKNSASIEEMQRSLSGSESGGCEKSAILDKSVSFAPQTQVVQVLSTPQVTATYGRARFLVAQGETKQGDDKPGHVRRLNKNEKVVTDGIWDVAEVDEENIEDGYEFTNTRTSCLPATLQANDQSCFVPSNDSFHDDPHLMLNASKAPTPLKCWPKADPIWNDIIMLDDENEVNNGVVDFILAAATLPLVHPNYEVTEISPDRFYEDPNLMLNASKAPSPKSDWSKEDSLWDWGFDQSPTKFSLHQDFNHTMWDTEANHESNFDFRESFEIAEVHETLEISSSRRRTQFCLVSPHSIVHLETQGLFLVTEPDQNRVGCYLEKELKFYSWLGYPKGLHHIRQQYEYPTSILSFSNACIVLLERDRLHIFDRSGKPIHSIGGKFCGLTEGPGGEILTLSQDSSGQPVIVKFEKLEPSLVYKPTGQMLITAVQEFENWEVLSQLKSLLYNKGKIYITDVGLHKLFIIDLNTKKQAVRGYLGSESGQFKRPTGLLADDMGNILVSDSGNDRLLIFTEEGKYLKAVQHKDVVGLYSPQGLCRKGKSFLAAFGVKDGDGVTGAVIEFKASGDSGISTSNEGSESGK